MCSCDVQDLARLKAEVKAKENHIREKQVSYFKLSNVHKYVHVRREITMSETFKCQHSGWCNVYPALI